MNEIALRIQQNPGTIEVNFDEIKKQLAERLKEYDGAVFTEDTKDIAKKEVANLRKLKKDVDSTRKEVKKKWLEPYEKFEGNMKELLKMVDEPIELIDSQLKAFENQRRQEKQQQISDVFAEVMQTVPEELQKYVQLARIYDPRWENATFAMKSVREAMEESCNRIIRDIHTLLAMKSDKEVDALKLYQESMDLGAAIDLITTYEQQKKEVLRREEEKKQEEERKQREAEERKRAEEKKQAEEIPEPILEPVEMEEEDVPFTMEPPFAVPEAESIPDVPVSPLDSVMESMLSAQMEVVRAVYIINGTPEEMKQVEMALNSLGVEWERRG